MSRRLGQHFLKNKGKIKEIVNSLELKRGNFVIEIGAGHGELTRELLARQDIKVIAVEKDGRLVEKLRENFKFLISNFETNPNDQNSKLKIIHDDALKILPSLIRNSKFKIKNSGYKVAGNIPYYITGKLLRVLGELTPKPELIVLTVQKEVALRIAAKPPKMNLLAASVQFWAEPEIVGFIPKKDFKPQPEVDSAIIKITPRPIAENSLLITHYYQLVKILFKQPRKTILNNLSAAFRRSDLTKLLKKAGINPADRPQNLDVADIQKLARILYN